MTRIALVLLVFATALRPSDATAQLAGRSTTFVVGAHLDGVVLGEHLDILEDPERAFRIEDIARGAHDAGFVRPKSETPSYGYTSSV
jgi:hypothetical protein